MKDDQNNPIKDDNANDAPAAYSETTHLSKFVTPGILLFADQLLVAIGNWIYWIIISKIATTAEIGHATTIYSLVLLVNTITQLGLEYPLLKKSHTHKNRIFGTALVIELAITGISIPLVLYTASSFYQESFQLAWLAIGILMLTSASFIMRFALLGITNAKIILISDMVGTVVKFTSAVVLILSGYGAFGILFSFFFQVLIIVGSMLISVKRSLGFELGNFRFSKEILMDGLINLPSKLSGTIIISLSIILLAYVGIDSSQVGIFYIAMMISIVVGSFASSLAFMSIPASTASKVDLSLGSLRIGLAFTAPIVTILILAPQTILSIIGKEYASAANILAILAAGVLPSVMVSNAMSRFNSQDRPVRLLAIGIVRLASFLAIFLILVPHYGTLGAAYSVSGSLISSAILSIVWSPKSSRYIAISIIAVLAGFLLGKAAEILADDVIFTIIVSLSAALAVILATKCTSIKEIKTMISAAKKV